MICIHRHLFYCNNYVCSFLLSLICRFCKLSRNRKSSVSSRKRRKMTSWRRRRLRVQNQTPVDQREWCSLSYPTSLKSQTRSSVNQCSSGTSLGKMQSVALYKQKKNKNNFSKNIQLFIIINNKNFKVFIKEFLIYFPVIFHNYCP